jgi:hypothetical protein
MHRAFALVLFIAIACGVLAQEPAADGARVAEAVGMVDADRYSDAIAILERTGGPDETRSLAKQSVSTNPDHASGHLLDGRYRAWMQSQAGKPGVPSGRSSFPVPDGTEADQPMA